MAISRLVKLATNFLFIAYCNGAESDIALDAKAQSTHILDSLNLLSYTLLLILTVLTIWLFKHRRVSFLHETGLAVIYGLIVGAIIRYAGSSPSVLNMTVYPDKSSKYNSSLPPDTLSLHFPVKGPTNIITNKTYEYVFRGPIVDVQDNEIDLKATFDPEIFFNIILPPIIFHAGYCLKRKYFFRNLGAILTYAIIGTTISSFVVGALMYGCVQLLPTHLANSFTFLDTLYFGALISSTDPLTVLAIFNDLHVDVNLYALVFGESVLNDAVAIVLSGSIQNYGERYQSGSGGFETKAFFKALGDFFGIFMLSLTIGAVMGCITALLTKFTRVRDFPLLESALFVLMSYSTFLIAEASDLTGVVAVLFCGICQAHYTYNNLSDDSRTRTKHMFELLNFLAENFIFSYIGVSMFTFPKHHFDPLFILAGFLCATIGRAINIYPLSFLLNLGRKPKIPANFQHMLFFAGLRGAMSFALAIRNTVSEARQTMLTTTSLIVIVTVIIQGGAAINLLHWLKIPLGIDDEAEALSSQGVRSGSTTSIRARDWNDGINMDGAPGSNKPNEKAILAQMWGSFDTKYMKPFLTHSRPTLLETLPVCCNPLARLLTTTEQMTQDGSMRPNRDSDSDLCIEENDLPYDRRSSTHRMVSKRKSANENEAGPSKKKVKEVEKVNYEAETPQPKKKIKKQTAVVQSDVESDLDISIVKEEIPEEDENKNNNVTETAHMNTDLLPWPQKHMEELLRKIESKLPKLENLTYKSRVEKIEWNDLAFGPYSGSECRIMWEGIQKRVRRYRILKELVEDAKEWVSKPWTNFYRGPKMNRHPDLPRRPLSTYMIFYLKKKDKVLQEHPGMDMTELSKHIAELYKQLSAKSKIKYKEMAAIQKTEYEEKMKEFSRLHPELVRTKLKKENKNARQSAPTLHDNAPVKPLTPFKLYCQDILKRVEHDADFDKATCIERCKEQWRTMSDKNKVFWINWSLDKEAKYQEELKKYIAENPNYIPTAYKSVVTKDERAIKERMAGKPEKPPNSAYSLFSRLMLVSEDVKKVNPKERMLVIAQQWKNCSPIEKKEYTDRVKHMLEQYKLQYAEYLESLPEEERQLELLNSQPKRKLKTPKTKPNSTEKESDEKEEPKEKKSSNSVTPKKKRKPREPKRKRPLKNNNLYEGEPPPPPATPYLLFLQTYKKHYPHKKDAPKQWGLLPDDQKDFHRQILTDMKRIYIESYENFLKGLTQEELKEYSEWKKQNQNLLTNSKNSDDENKSDKDDDDDKNSDDESDSDKDDIKEESQDDPDSDSDSSDSD